MLSTNQVNAYFDLQSMVFSIDDPNEIMAIIMPQILKKIDGWSIDCQVVSAVFFDNEFYLEKYFFVDKNLFRTTQTDNNILNKAFVKNDQLLINMIKDGQIAVSNKTNELFDHSYTDRQNINFLIISPIIYNEKEIGVLILGAKNPKERLSEDEKQLVKLLSNFTALSYRLQDTQSSLTDVTKEVYKMNAELHQLDKLKDDFVSVASHELRTPMTAIRSYAWMALNKADIPLSEKLKKYLSRTLISTERLINLVNDMLNVSRIESGRVEVAPQVFDIKKLVLDVFNEVEVKAAEKKINLNMVEENIPQVFADSDKVHQVLLNLLGNALKFTPVGGRIAVTFFTDGGSVEISVTDSGVGITKEDLSRLFKKFGRLDNSYVAAATSGGTGLGLYICKSLVDLMGGKIWASSEGLGKGSTFTFSLPVANEDNIKDKEKYSVSVEDGAKVLEPVTVY